MLLDIPYRLSSKEEEEIEQFLCLLEDSGIGPMVAETAKSGPRKPGRRGFDHCMVLAAIIFGFAFSKGTLREIESSMKYDLRYRYIMLGEEPDHTTIGRVINDVVVPNAAAIFAAVASEIVRRTKADASVVYVDGTKFEANANKYKFVWKPTTFHKRISATANGIIGSLSLIEGYEPEELIGSRTVAYALTHLGERQATPETESASKALASILAKVLEYEEKERICGEGRKSYYKTDHDATAMCLKSDYYSGLGSNMHAAYNVQVAAASGIPVGYVVTQSRTDIKDFQAAVESCVPVLGGYPKKVAADAGYGSLENYRYMRERGIKSFVKHQSWEGNSSGSRPECLRMSPDGRFLCLNGLEARHVEIPGRHPKKAGGSFLRVEGCLSCPFSPYCKRFMKKADEDFKLFEVNVEMEGLKAESEANLMSVEGIEVRVNRSIQAEGVFGQVKQNMGYWRARRRSIGKVSAEVMLTLLGAAVRKYFQCLAKGSLPAAWKAPEGTESAKFKKPSAKRLAKKGQRMREKLEGSQKENDK